MKYLLIGVSGLNILLIAGIVYLYFKAEKKNESPVQTIVNTFYDSTKVITKPVYITEIKEKWLRDTIRLEIPANVDTAEIIREYFTSRSYLHEYRDSNLVITINDSVKFNSIAYRNLTYKLLRPYLTETINILPEAKWNWMVGFNYEFRQPYPGVVPTFGFNYKAWSLMAGYNLIYKTSSIQFNYKLNAKGNKQQKH